MDRETFLDLYGVDYWREFLLAGEQRAPEEDEELSALRYALRCEYPIGGAAFVEELKSHHLAAAS